MATLCRERTNAAEVSRCSELAAWEACPPAVGEEVGWVVAAAPVLADVLESTLRSRSSFGRSCGSSTQLR